MASARAKPGARAIDERIAKIFRIDIPRFAQRYPLLSGKERQAGERGQTQKAFSAIGSERQIDAGIAANHYARKNLRAQLRSYVGIVNLGLSRLGDRDHRLHFAPSERSCLNDFRSDIVLDHFGAEPLKNSQRTGRASQDAGVDIDTRLAAPQAINFGLRSLPHFNESGHDSLAPSGGGPQKTLLTAHGENRNPEKNIPRRLKPRWSLGLYGTTEQAAENFLNSVACGGNELSGG